MVILDKSSSMQKGTIAGSTKWSIAVDALTTVVTEFENKIELGLTMFPNPNQCSPGTVNVEPGLGKRADILAQLADAPPSTGNWTPMSQTLEAVATEPSLVNTTNGKYAVLITDGWQWCDPYDASTRFDPVDAVRQLNAAGVTTYVVGFGGAVDALTLNSVAVEAGTARAGCDPTGDTPTSPNPCYYQADDPTSLVAALRTVATNASTEICDGLDNDCDGEIDEDLTRSCGTACGTGTETCVAGAWAGCDAPEPEAEICDGLDNDCDGTADPGCECAAGETRDCGGTETAGACQPGTQTCAADGTWGTCAGAVTPQNEMCDGVDNDCDGQVDETTDDVGGLCGPGFICVDGGCDPMDPVQPVPDDDPTPPQTPAGDDGAAAAGCGCATGGDAGGNAGTLALLMLAGVLGLRRRRRG